ncbi:MAG TPA: hypothetical protein VFR37_05120 [Longimicrobium sp.]|nr:hypothetical protein [Longimicrobium sp.]
MPTTKAEVRELLGALPDDCLLEGIEHALHVRHTIHQAEATGENCILEYRRRLGHHPEMLEGSAKDEVLQVLDLLDESCSLADVYYTFYVRESIRRGDWSLQNERTYTQEEMEQRLARWLKD